MGRHFDRLLMTAAVALGFAGTSAAQVEQDRADARCYMVLQMLGAVGQREGLLKVENRSQIDVMSAYFIGKIRGRNPASTPIATIITPDIASAAAANYMKEAGACIDGGGQYKTDVNAAVTVIRDAMRQMDEEAARPPKSGN